VGTRGAKVSRIWISNTERRLCGNEKWEVPLVAKRKSHCIRERFQNENAGSWMNIVMKSVIFCGEFRKKREGVGAACSARRDMIKKKGRRRAIRHGGVEEAYDKGIRYSERCEEKKKLGLGRGGGVKGQKRNMGGNQVRGSENAIYGDRLIEEKKTCSAEKNGRAGPDFDSSHSYNGDPRTTRPWARVVKAPRKKRGFLGRRKKWKRNVEN